MKVTNEGWAGLLALLVNLTGAILSIVLSGDWVAAIPLILGVVDAVGLLVIWILSRQTKAQIASLQYQVKSLGG